MADPIPQDLARATLEGWERNAAYWDEHQGDEGADWEREYIGPAAERLLGLGRGDRLVELACGTGAFARRMARLGVQVTASDFSPKMIALAERRSEAFADQIRYQVIDAADAASLAGLGPEPYDGAVCNMALFGMPEIAPLFTAMATLIKPGGAFVFSVLHPAFGSTLPTFVREEAETPSGEKQPHALKISRYKSAFMTRGVAGVGQPEKQFYFHRPLEALLAPGFEAGLMLDALEEPALPAKPLEDSKLMWDVLPELPPLLIARMRRPAG